MWTIRQLRWLVWGVLCGTAVWIALTAGGLFDAQPRGRPQDTWPARRLSLAVGETARVELPAVLPSTFEVRMTGSAEDADAAYGVAFGDEQAFWAVAVSGRGYLAVWEERDGETTWQRPWQPWLHVAFDRPNELWVAVGEDGVTVRINRELLGRFPLPAGAGRCDVCRLSVWAHAPRSAAVVTVGPVVWFASADGRPPPAPPATCTFQFPVSHSQPPVAGAQPVRYNHMPVSQRLAHVHLTHSTKALRLVFLEILR